MSSAPLPRATTTPLRHSWSAKIKSLALVFYLAHLECSDVLTLRSAGGSLDFAASPLLDFVAGGGMLAKSSSVNLETTKP